MITERNLYKMNNDKNTNDTPMQKKSVRILALVGVILLVALYGSTLVFALISSPHAFNLLMTSIVLTILIPVLIYTYQLIYRLLNKKADSKGEDKK